MYNLSENEDWQVTKEIYGDAIIEERENEVTLQIPISLVNTICIRVRPEDYRPKENDGSNKSKKSNRNKDKIVDKNGVVDRSNNDGKFNIYPKFQYVALSDLINTPMIQIKLEYKTSNQPTNMEMTMLHYPQLFPYSHKTLWMEWIIQRANDILQESQLSYTVCDFLEHDVMQYFHLLHNTKQGYSAIVFTSNEFGYYDHTWENASSIISKHPSYAYTNTNASCNSPSIYFVENIRQKITLALPIHELPIHKFARQILKRHWKRYYKFECPICFMDDICENGIELPCDHIFCKDCIDMYVKVKLSELSLHRRNPFVCPIPSCKANMNVLSKSKSKLKSKLISNPKSNESSILNDNEKDQVRLWKKNLDYPLSHMLTICPLPSCEATEMRMINNDKVNTFVKCNVCNAIFCELCMKRISKHLLKDMSKDKDKDIDIKKVQYNHREECDERMVLKLIRKYLQASTELQIQCESKMKWIKQYASSRNIDASASLWVKEYASTCPTCKNAIERSEGCFHMKCLHCGTHFCYECGDELFYPYYGTHHCWEQNQNRNDMDQMDDIQFQLFG